MKHKVAVIGAGYFGQRHIKVLSQMEDVDIVGVADKDVNKAAETSKQYGLRYSDNFIDFLDEAEVFFIVTPTNTHFEIAMKLIEQNKNIFVEKPLVESINQALILINQARRKKIIFQVGLIERYNPAVITLSSHIRNPSHIAAQRLSPFSGRATDTDVTFDLMIHDIDLIWFILRKFGKITFKEFRCFQKSFVTDKTDFASVWLSLELNQKNISANLTANRASPYFQRTISIVENDCLIFADLINKRVTKVDSKGVPIEVSVKNNDAQPLYEEIRDFLDAVNKRKPSKRAPTYEEIIEVLKIINQIKEYASDETLH